MHGFHYNRPSQIGFEHPLCLACGMRMWLTLIEPADKPNYDARTFECLECHRSETVIIEIRPQAKAFLAQ